VLQGTIIVEVEGERVAIGPREFCGFPRGTYHQIVEVHPPLECLVLRNSGGYDKSYLLPDGTITADSRYHRDIIGLLNGSKESTTQ